MTAPARDKVLYVAGPMSGYPEHNFPAFNRAAATLRDQGYAVINPAENDGGATDAGDWAYYMRQDIRHISHSDALVMLPGWQHSRGANLEVHIARQFDMPLYRLDENDELGPLWQLIGLSGYARSGKDAAIEVLEGLGWRRVAFADKVREALYWLDPLLPSQRRVTEVVDSQGWESAKALPEVRSLLQRIGTEVGRMLLGNNIWIDLAFKGLEDGGKYVFTDARFPNEADAIVKAGGRMLRIQRPGYGPVNGHVSEVALDDYDFDQVLLNDGTLEDWHRLVAAVVS